MATNVPLCLENEVSEADFARMMSDETFVDFFNVFLSLPAFSQRLVYIFPKKNFEFDPPIRRRNFILQRHNVIEWLLKERLPFFMRSEFYLDYLLCKGLIQLELHLTTSSHRLDYEEIRILEDKEIVKTSVGHVVGMCHLQKFLEETPGGELLSFWKDAERFHRIPTEHKSMREVCFREIQIKYFKTDGLVNLPDNSLWQALQDSSLAMESDYQNLGKRKTAPTSFKTLQTEVLSILKKYWLQRYILHKVAGQAKQEKSTDENLKFKSTSDAQAEKDMEDIDKAYEFQIHSIQQAESKLGATTASPVCIIDGDVMPDSFNKMLALAQGSGKTNKSTLANKAAFNWHAMFPHTKIDDSFLNSTDDVVTIHKDNKITVCPVGSEFDMMLQRYFSDSDSDEEEILPSSPNYVPKWDMAPMAKLDSEDEPENLTRKLVAQIAEVEEEQKRKKKKQNPRENLALFEQMLREKEAYDSDESDNFSIQDLESERPRTSGQFRPKKAKTKGTGSEHVDLRLPLLGDRWKRDPNKQHTLKRHRHRDRLGHKKIGSGIIRNQFPPITGTVPPEGKPTEPLTCRKPPEVDVMEFEFTNLCKGNYRCDNKLFLNSIAVDAVCGRPFASYLHKYNHKEAITTIRFWTEIHTYLSLKPSIKDAAVFERLSFWRAHKMIVRFLSKELPSPIRKMKDSSSIPSHARESIRRMVYHGKGDETLAMVQDYLSKELFVLWQSYIYMDKDNFEISAQIRSTGRNLLKRGPQIPRTLTPETETGNSSPKSPEDILDKFRRKVSRVIEVKQEERYRRRETKGKIIRFTLGEVADKIEGGSVSPMLVAVDPETLEDETPPKTPEGKASPDKDGRFSSSPDRPESNRGKPIEKLSPSPDRLEGKEKPFEKSPSPKSPRPKAVKKTSEIKERIGSSSKKKGEEKKEIESSEMPLLVEQFDLKGLKEKRTWRALQIVAFLTNLETDSLLVAPLPLDEIQFNTDGTSGSLAMKSIKVVRRRDLVEAEARKKQADVQAYNTRMALLKKKEVDDLPKEFLDDSIPEWAKPFKGENGRWVYRPSYPRTFTEIFKDPMKIEFFKRYLEANGSAAQLNFWKEVDSMKRATDTSYRQQKINQILRRFFISPRGYASLDCNDDVIKEIPKMEKVTPAMLISGQSCIAKLLEQKWFLKYQATFPEPEGDEDGDEKKEVTRQWSTERSRALWVQFVRTVMRFRHAVLDPKLTKEFADYLRLEIIKETERQRASGINYVPGLPIKKVVRNKLVDITKLVNDLAFLAEAERFRSLCDNAADAAKQGIYKQDDQQLLDLKAHIIITCYLDSEIPPRIQINASTDAVDQIIASFQSGLVDRGLFHAATMGTFPVLAYMWKRFQKFRYAQMFGTIKIDDKTQVLNRAISPNFMDLKHTDGKTIVSLHEDDQPRLVFSLGNGLRTILPPTREQLLRRALEATLGRGGADGSGSLTEVPSTRRMTMALLGHPEKRHRRRSKTGHSKNHSMQNVTEEGEGEATPKSGSGSSGSDISVVPISNLARRTAVFAKKPGNALVNT